jgi:hypothetical protein
MILVITVPRGSNASGTAALGEHLGQAQKLALVRICLAEGRKARCVDIFPDTRMRRPFGARTKLSTCGEWCSPAGLDQFFLRNTRPPGASTVTVKFERIPVPKRPASPGKNARP